MTFQCLPNILKKHKYLFSVAALLWFIGALTFVLTPFMRLTSAFAVFCGFCCAAYAILLQLEHSSSKPVAATARVCRITAVILICIFTVSFTVIQFFIISSEKDDDTPCNRVIVLGCGLNGKTPSAPLACRLERAYEYLEANPQCQAILCGGRGAGELISEAEAMYEYLTNREIEPSRLVCEDKSRDTRENINNALELIKSSGGSASEPIAAVSNGFHLYRLKLLMKKAGFAEVHTLCAKTPSIPVLVLNLHLREYFSVVLEYINL